MASGPLRAHAFRLEPGQDLVSGLQNSAQNALSASKSRSVLVLTAVGSLSDVTLRMASASADSLNPEHDLQSWTENMEILSLVGTFTGDLKKHLHLCLSLRDGTTIGGHLVSGTILTTLELVLGTIDGVNFDREHDTRTGYAELTIKKE